MAGSKAYLVISSITKPAKQDLLHKCLSQAMPLAMAAVGTPVGRNVATHQLVGEGGPSLIAIVEFADAQAIDDMVVSAEFAALGDLRNEVFKRLDMVVCAAM